jgi:predicted enzyme related to lactoylglutathione lyase
MNIRRVVPDILTERIDESTKFYTEFFGFKVAMDMGWVMTLVSPSNETAQITLVKGKSPVVPDFQVALTIEVEDVDAMYQKAREMNIDVVYPITNEPWGVRRFHVIDPNGVIINVMQHIKNV